MSNYNSATLHGRLTRDSELKFLPSGTGVLNFSVASNSGQKDKEETFFLDCAMFGDRAEKLCEYLKKGKEIIVRGKLRSESWTKDSVKVTKVSLLVDEVVFVSGSGKAAE